MDMQTTPRQVAPTTEIIGAVLLETLPSTEKTDFVSDPKSYLYTKLNIDVADNPAVQTVTNDDKVIHLSLPYYDCITAESTQQLSDVELEDIGGGEIFISIIVGLIVGTGVGIGVTAIAGGGSAAVVGGILEIALVLHQERTPATEIYGLTIP